MSKESIAVGLFVYLIMLFTQTFIMNSGENSIHLIPFEVITAQIHNIYDNAYNWKPFIFNVVGNICVFIPVGIMISYLLENNFKRTILYCLIISLFIETVQIPLERTTDIDDIILNTTGAFVGCLICKSVLWALKKRELSDK